MELWNRRDQELIAGKPEGLSAAEALSVSRRPARKPTSKPTSKPEGLSAAEALCVSSRSTYKIQ